ncbi:ubiquinol--cytochrome-c reductase subunit 6 [Modicella reniformis]|uniref:Ubiquinol--cytochrome-c reductase subunit 6 n=1 Tax=Modicella reniformis TaxID=1440133 RepID=A0A9P6SVC2_9FUNG|nr:ubiquinol--cytochrome-c reductase subunit 6 [Modicella reniformis]
MMNFITALLPTVYAEEKHEEAPAERVEEKEEEEAPAAATAAAAAAEEPEDPEDMKPSIEEACAETSGCSPLKHHLEECASRVEGGAHEDCIEELYHFLHCVNECAVPKFFDKLA